jgi:YVTN family beta-propeller protein
MKRAVIWLIFIAVVVLAGAFVHRWGMQHAQYMTGGAPHPANCLPCHLYLDQDSKLARLIDKRYISPLDIAVAQEGKILLVTGQESNQVLVLNAEHRKIEDKIDVGAWPYAVVSDDVHDRAFVSNHWSGTVFVLDLQSRVVTDTIAVGSGPSGMALTQEGNFLYVANSFSNNLSVIDLRNMSEVRRLPTGDFPIAVGVSPDGSRVLVTHRRSRKDGFRKPPVTEVTVIDPGTQRIVTRLPFTSAHLFENISFTPSGDLAVFTLVRPKNLVPSTQIERGFMITEGIGVLQLSGEMKSVQLLLDEPNDYFPDPFDIAISPDGSTAYVSHAGVDRISIVDLNAVRGILNDNTQEALHTLANHMGMGRHFIRDRIATGANPKGLALSPDGKSLYIAQRFEDNIAILDTDSREVRDVIDLGGPSSENLVRLGGRLFYNAGRTFQNQYSCSTCHPDGGEDGLTYDLTGTGRDLENTITLRELSNTGPFKWNGKNVSVYMQCGMRFSKFVTRTESFTPRELNALVAFIFQKLENPPNWRQMPASQLTEAQKRGKEIFERSVTNTGEIIPERDRCVTCHPAPYFTDRSAANVGSGFETDTEELFDTPKLNNIADTPPYLHDGRAATLEEIWTVYGGEDYHGIVNDLTKQQLNDLVEYLKGIGPAHTYISPVDVKHASYE